MCTNPHCFEDTCQGECTQISEIVLSPKGDKTLENKVEEHTPEYMYESLYKKKE